MSDLKKKRRDAVSEPTTTIFDRTVCGPGMLELSDATDNHGLLAEWVDRIRQYVQTMHGLDRAAMICWISDEGKMYLASVDERP